MTKIANQQTNKRSLWKWEKIDHFYMAMTSVFLCKQQFSTQIIPHPVFYHNL